ncbi:hypothetical protein QH494_20230 [Sphingomonas sp. AR_OL41]|jgi:hypothetical protein|uniref:hypothetical protein n=1 Tax=Sphingomonas sp. AR_OL41 TaxID=3042729 RepID=UPI00247FBB2B|nr:hypothetical protein [Sphingomonas sp. AR_OL41]MDH7974524.1 hypothetical protein [Sphingomonas sp. AR_OL41]
MAAFLVDHWGPISSLFWRLAVRGGPDKVHEDLARIRCAAARQPGKVFRREEIAIVVCG